jgi:hypothetical protein
MREPRGSIIVCGDYKGDLPAIVKALNNSLWFTSDEARFKVRHGAIRLDRPWVEIPTVHPDRIRLAFADGKTAFLDEARPSERRSWEAQEIDGRIETASLGALSKKIAPLLTRGSLELVAVALGGDGQAYLDRLVVRCDGSAERHSFHCDAFKKKSWSSSETERFVPKRLGTRRKRRRRRAQKSFAEHANQAKRSINRSNRKVQTYTR